MTLFWLFMERHRFCTVFQDLLTSSVSTVKILPELPTLLLSWPVCFVSQSCMKKMTNKSTYLSKRARFCLSSLTPLPRILRWKQQQHVFNHGGARWSDGEGWWRLQQQRRWSSQEVSGGSLGDTRRREETLVTRDEHVSTDTESPAELRQERVQKSARKMSHLNTAGQQLIKVDCQGKKHWYWTSELINQLSPVAAAGFNSASDSFRLFYSMLFTC